MPFASIQKNILASIVVFFVAIPLCLGIALASGASLFSGVISGIIGGIIVGSLSHSNLSVSGPAAGMIAIVVSAITQLGSFEVFLFALLLAGILQTIAGLLRIGFIANFVPTTVIQGLLAAIGILIIFKQLPLALGYFPETENLGFSLTDLEHVVSWEFWQNVFLSFHMTALLMTLISLSLLISWGKLFPNAAKVFPAAILAIVATVAINNFLTSVYPEHALTAASLVNIPHMGSINDFFSQFKYPDFSAWENPKLYTFAITIAIVASLETLLNIDAVKKLDPKHEYCPPNRELIAQGIGNMTSGLVGGLPITSVIVRSSVNINAGATSKLSTILHGIFLLFSVTVLSKYLNYIPLPVLAAILIHTGYKLAHIALFKEVYKEGATYFIPFIVTIIAIVFINLLVGIIIGLIISIFFILRRNSKACFTQVDEIHPCGKVLRLILPSQVTFLHKAAIIEELDHLPEHTKVIIDANSTDYIDQDILSIIKEFDRSQAPNKSILLNLEGFKRKYNIPEKTRFITATTYDVQSAMTPDIVLQVLKEGNHRFIKNTPINKNYKQQITATSDAQYPIAVVLSCIDSRVPVELIFDLSVGDVFVVRVAGNVINSDVLASIEFACKVGGAKVIMILGHKECGAIKAACDNASQGEHLPELLHKIQPAIDLEKETKTNRTSKNKKFLLNVTCNNVELSRKELCKESKTLRELVNKKQVNLLSALYDVKTGKVKFL